MNNEKIQSWTKGCLAFAVMSLMLLTSCSDDSNDTPTIATNNPAAFVKDAAKLEMLRSMKDKDGTGRLYEINYTADYKLDAVLQSNCTETTQLFGYIAYSNGFGGQRLFPYLCAIIKPISP